jgi:hypothetical protein
MHIDLEDSSYTGVWAQVPGEGEIWFESTDEAMMILRATYPDATYSVSGNLRNRWVSAGIIAA